MIGGLDPKQALQKILMQAEGEKDRQSSASQTARDMMEAFSPQNVLGKVGEILGIIGKISG